MSIQTPENTIQPATLKFKETHNAPNTRIA
jgi:hypothetical protein